MNKKTLGFTLAEIVIVIGILVILSVISFLSFQTYSRDARDSNRLQTLTNYQKALDQTFSDKGQYPTPDEAINLSALGVSLGTQGNIGDGVSTAIDSTLAKDPLDQSYYTYRVSSTGKESQLFGILEGGFLDSVAGTGTGKYILFGDELGIVLSSDNIPSQRAKTDIDIVTTTGSYKGIKNKDTIFSGTGLVLKNLTPNYLLKIAGGDGTNLARSVAFDSNNNMYVISHYSKGLHIGFDDDQIGYSSTGAYVTKISSSGKTMWIKSLSFSGVNIGTMNAITVDAFGSIYVVGSIPYNIGQKDFDGNIIPLIGLIDGFIAKFDNNGIQKWFKVFGGSGVDSLQSIAIGDNNILYTGGFFTNAGAKDFSGGALGGGGGNDGVVFKMDTTTGNQLSVKTIFGGNTDVIMSLAVGENNDVYVGGYVDTTVPVTIFDSTFLTSGKGGSDMFIARLDSQLNQLFFKNAGGSSHEYMQSIHYNKQYGLFVSGYYSSTNMVDFGGNTLPQNGTSDAYIAKLDPMTGQQVWAKTMGGNLTETATSIATDTKGNVYIGGAYATTLTGSNMVVDFGGNPLLGKSTSNAYADAYIAKLDKTGTFQGIKTAGGSGLDIVYAIGIDNNQDIVILGQYHNNNANVSGCVDFLGYPLLGKGGVTALTGFPQIFLQKILNTDF